jgi:hypothetical protein
MSMRLFVLLVVIAVFGALSTVAVREVGYFGLVEPHFQSWGASQILVDLVILGVLACIWMVADARARALNPWPFVVLTVIGGSFGPLVYLVFREVNRGARHARGLTSRPGQAA